LGDGFTAVGLFLNSLLTCSSLNFLKINCLHFPN
jgi:hypothetical protein